MKISINRICVCIAAFYFTTNAVDAQFTTTSVLPGFTDPIENSRADDMDNDGDPDLVFRSGLNIMFAENTGNLQFNSPVVIGSMPQFGPGTGERDLYIIDFDEDGWLDVVCMVDKFILAFKNEGNSSYTPITVFEAFNVGGGLGMGDIDSDGQSDFYLTGSSINKFNYLGDYSFSGLVTIHADPLMVQNTMTSYGGPEMMVADYTGDGINDITSGYNWVDIDVPTMLISGSTFDPFTENFNASTWLGNNIYYMDIADFDNDGDMDWIKAEEQSTITVIYNNGSGGISSQFSSNILGSGPPSLLMDDVNGDGWVDIIVSGNLSTTYQDAFPTDGPATYVVYNDGAGGFPGITEGAPFVEFIVPFAAIYVPLQAVDFDGDGVNEYFKQSTIIHGEVLETYISASVYLDGNANSVMDMDESPLFGQQFDYNGQIIYSDSNGQFDILVGDGTHQINYISNSLRDLTTSGSYTVSVIDGVADQSSLLFGLVPNGAVYSVEANFNAFTGVCGGNGINYVNVTNTGNMPVQGTVTLYLDPLYTYINSVPAPISQNGNTIVWEYPQLQANETFEIFLFAQKPSSDYLGQTMIHNMEVVGEDSNGVVQFNGTNENSYELECSYDPNDKTSHIGWTDAGYVLSNTQHEYTIRFQNTGNAPATTVRIEDQLSDLLQWNTLHPIAWSHDFDLVIDENGRAIFNFENIMLPDSQSDEEGSQGFVRFTIEQDSNLEAPTEIENTAYIYFDLNEPIVTNTVLNTIMECEGLADYTFDFDNGCPGTYVLGNANSDLGEIYSWTIDELEVSTGTNLYTALLESGTYDVVLNVTNPLCDVSSAQPFLVHEVTTPIITLNNDELLASGSGLFQWTYNGVIIEGANSSTYGPLEDGTYTVSVVDENGCFAVSEEFAYTMISTRSDTVFQVWPNPFSENCSVIVGNPSIGQFIRVNDVHGRLVHEEILMDTNLELNTSEWTSGVYVVRIGNSNPMRLVKQ